MNTMQQRLAALEKTANPDNRVTAIIDKIVTPGMVDAEVIRITSPAGQEWVRQDHESEEQFTERALREVVRFPNGFATLVAHPGEVAARNAHPVSAD